MFTSARLTILVVGIPLVASLFELVTGTEISERHHVHHDTYSVSRVVPRTMLLVMVFMGVLGGLTNWLCQIGVYSADPSIPMGFFVAFQLTMLVMLVGISRCQAMTYNDRMIVRPMYGRMRTLAYRDITRIERRTTLVAPHFQDLRIHVASGDKVRVSGLLDTEQMLLRIDRFDALDA